MKAENTTHVAQSNPTGYSISFRIRLFRALIRPVFRLIFYILCRVKVTGKENVPRQGAYLIAINHISLYEAPFILSFWPSAPEVIGAVDIWSKPGQSTLARLYGGIPLHRGEYDRRAIQAGLNVLNSGRPLLIAPEGGRSHVPGMRRAQPGIAFLLDLVQVPVLPVGFIGTTDDMMDKALRGKKPWIEMRIGKPFFLPLSEGKGEARRESRQRNSDLIMHRIADLLPVEYRGVYQDDPANTA
jgi:1-acyl-sn-glycerol-3-phosphate acyltransferase